MRQKFISIKNSLIDRSIVVNALIHLGLYLMSKRYRDIHSLVDAGPFFFYRLNIPVTRFIFYPILFFLKKIFAARKILISIDNIFAIGHIYPEIDELIRILDQEKYRDFKIIYAYPSTNLIYKNIFHADRLILIESGLVHCVLTVAAMCDPSFAISAGHSQVSYIDQCNVSLREVFLGRQVRAATSRKRNPSFFPLRKYGDTHRFPDELKSLVGPPGSYVLVQIKDYAVNGTFKAVDPLTYDKVFEYLTVEGYTIVLGGRESYPTNFYKFGVVDYANSDVANALTDYWLVHGAKFILGSASGFCFIPEALDKPLVSINSWQHIPCIGRKTINVPSRLVLNGEPLSFEQQLNLATRDVTADTDYFSSLNYSVIDASPDEILSAIREIIVTVENHDESIRLTELQKKIKTLYPQTLAGVGQSVVSEYFLLNHNDYFFN